MLIDEIAFLLAKNNINGCVNKLYENITILQNTIEDYVLINKNFKNIEFDYKIKPLLKKLKTKKKLNKFDNFCFIHYSIYEILNKKTEFIANNDISLKIFPLYLLFYFTETTHNILNNINSYISMDFEFNNQKIALMQICFTNKNTKNILWLINPTQMLKKSYFIKYIMINKNVTKILHGADSLDIPYLYKTLLNNNKLLIREFTKRYIDTRFLCEYFRNSIDDGNVCSIYDALEYFGTITKKEYNKLYKIHEDMKKIKDKWDINNLNKYRIKYAKYDVYYLRQFLKDIYSRAYNETPDEYPFYQYIIALNRFIMLERKNVTAITSKIKNSIDKFNNYVVKHKNKYIKLSEIYKTIIKDIYIKNIGLELDNLLSINYFKTYIVILLKKIIYHIITTNFDVHKTKKSKNKIKIGIDDIYMDLHMNSFKRIIYLLKNIQSECKKKIMLLYK